MRKFNLTVLCFIVSIAYCYCQKFDVSGYYGRFWSPYKFIDYGTGYKNNPASNYNFFPSVAINKYYTKSLSMEGGIFFTLYEQYYGTRKYKLAFESTYGIVHLSVRAGYSLINRKKIECRVKSGISLGIAPDLYEGEYLEMFIFPIIDSITRGNIKRNFTPIFPMISVGLDFSYKIAKRFKLSAAANYQKGFLKITEYDIYYNDGSGRNDQRAKQWGAGDFYGIQLGLRYMLRDENGKKFEIRNQNSRNNRRNR